MPRRRRFYLMLSETGANSFTLIPERIKALVEKLPRVSAEINTSLKDFAQFLDQVSDPGQ